MTVLDSTQTFMREAESLICETKISVKWKWLQAIADHVMNAPFYSLSGVALLVKPFVLCLALAPFWFLVLKVIGMLGRPMPLGQAVWLAIFSAMNCVIFGLPSRGSAYGVKAHDVNKLATLLLELAPEEEDRVLIRKALDSVSARSTEKIVFIKGALALAWGALLWALSHSILDKDLAANAHSSDATYVALLSVFVLVFGLGTWSYSAITRVLYQTIDFAFLEATHLEKSKDKAVVVQEIADSDPAAEHVSPSVLLSHELT